MNSSSSELSDSCFCKSPNISYFAIPETSINAYTLQFDDICKKDKDSFIPNVDSKVNYNQCIRLLTHQFKMDESFIYKIWNLCDFDSDGFLNLLEFCLLSHIFNIYSLTKNELPSKEELYENFQAFLNSNNGEKEDDLSDGESCSSLLSNQSNDRKPFIGDYKQYSDDQVISNQENDDSVKLSPDEDHTALLSPFSHNEIPCFSSVNDQKYSKSHTASSISAKNSSDESSSDHLDSTDENDVVQPFMEEINTKEAQPHVRYTKRADPIRVLAQVTGRSPLLLSKLAPSQRRRLLKSLVQQAKLTNHILLRLNNELLSEANELSDQRESLKIQLKHLVGE